MTMMATKIVSSTLPEEPEKRRKIISAARELFAQKRYDNVTVPEIVKVAGVAQGTFYRYFTSKTNLVEALSDEVHQETVRAIKEMVHEDKDFLELIEPLTRTALKTLENYKDILPFLNTDALLFGESDEAEKRREPFQEIMTALIERDQRAKKISAAANPHLTARLVDGLIGRLIKECLLYPDKTPVEAYIQEVVGFVSRALKR